jgi:hypothetical protein
VGLGQPRMVVVMTTSVVMDQKVVVGWHFAQGKVVVVTTVDWSAHLQTKSVFPSTIVDDALRTRRGTS